MAGMGGPMTDKVRLLAEACAKAGVHIDKRPSNTPRKVPCESCLPAVEAIAAALPTGLIITTTEGLDDALRYAAASVPDIGLALFEDLVAAMAERIRTSAIREARR